MGETVGGGPEAAVAAVASRARRARAAAAERLDRLGIGPVEASRAVDGLLGHARLTLNFHPDRRDATGRTVAAGLSADGRYRSQFETGISNGGRFAVPGGARVRWEDELFDRAYDGWLADRPVYGALDLFADAFGGSPRFGSSFLVLTPACLERATLCVGDSHLGPADLGTVDEPLAILAGAVEACADGDGFGRGLSVSSFLDAIGRGERGGPSARQLDRYVEAQVHGPIDLGRDVVAVHLDPSFRGTMVERDLRAAADRHRVELAWSEGSELCPDDVAPDFRGPEVATLARQTTRPDGLVDAASIGRALDDVAFTPPSVDGDPEDSPRQRYKKLWHCCLAFGAPPPV